MSWSYEVMDAGPVGPPRPPRRWPWVVGAVVGVVVFGALALVVADWAARNLEMRALLAAVERSEAAMGDTQQAVAAELDPLTQRTEPLAEDERQQLLEDLSGVAAQGDSAVTSAGDAVSSVFVLPWHTAIRDARTAYLAHNMAWQDYLSAATDDPAEFVRPQQAVNDTFAAAEPMLRAALPAPALFDLPTRVDAVFADLDEADPTPAPGEDGGGSGGGDGQQVSARGP